MESSRASKLAETVIHDTIERVRFVETQTVKEGVECDVYTIDGDDSMDLAVVRVQPGLSTPLQLVKSGVRTTELFNSGAGSLEVTRPDGVKVKYSFTADSRFREVDVHVGDTMQWTADGIEGLEFYEICIPPYQDGRFEDLD